MNFTWPDYYISGDMRSKPTCNAVSYAVSQEFFNLRHSICLPPNLVKGAHVLDLGCYLGATGYYCVENRCEQYVGVENIRDYYLAAKNNLAQYKNVNIYNHEINTMLSLYPPLTRFDVVLLWGVINSYYNPIPLIERCLELGDNVYIDCALPACIRSEADLQQYSVIEINPHSCQMQARATDIQYFTGSRVSPLALQTIGALHGYEHDWNCGYNLCASLPDTYGWSDTSYRRWMSVLRKNPNMAHAKTYETVYCD